MRYFILVVSMAMAGLQLLTPGNTLAAGTDEWSFTLVHGAGMKAEDVAATGDDVNFLCRFGRGRSSVYIMGEDPLVDVRRFLPPFGIEIPRFYPDLMLLVTMRVDTIDGNRVHVRGRIDRWQSLGTSPPWDYRFTEKTIDQWMDIGGSWHLPGGTDRTGNAVYVEIAVDQAESERADHVARSTATVPVRFTYEMLDQRSGNTVLFKTTKIAAIRMSDGESDPLHIEAPARIKGVDSSVLALDLWLNAVQTSRQPDAVESQAEAVFNMDRTLILNIRPTDDSTTINAGKMIMSSFEHAVTLKPGKRIRIELPQQENEGLRQGISEVIEIEPLGLEGPR